MAGGNGSCSLIAEQLRPHRDRGCRNCRVRSQLAASGRNR